MKIFSLALILFGLAACSPSPIVINPTTPRATIVAESTLNTARMATKVKKNIETAAINIKSIQTDTEKGKVFAGQMKKSPTITPEQLEANYKNWDSLDFKIKFLEASLKPHLIDASELEASALYGKQESEKLVNETKESDKTIIRLKDDAADKAGDVALGKLTKGIIYTLITVFVISILLYIATKFSLIKL